MPLGVSLLAVFALVAMLGEVTTRLVVHRRRTTSSTASAAASLMAPVIAAGSVCLALVWPGLSQEACHCIAHGLHHPHLCLRHPDYAALVLVPASVVALSWGLFVLPGMGRLVASLWRTQLWARRISRSPEQVLHSVRFRLIDAPGLGAGTAGLFRPLIAVDRGLWLGLSDDERSAVLHHEEAHRRRLDPLSLLVLRVCACLTFVPGRTRLLDAWQAEAEKECDRYAAQVTESPESVASALLALERYHRDQSLLAPPFAASAGATHLEGRVRSLLADGAPARPPRLASDVLAVSLIGVAVCVAFTLLVGDAIHHGAETALGLFVHHH